MTCSNCACWIADLDPETGESLRRCGCAASDRRMILRREMMAVTTDHFAGANKMVDVCGKDNNVSTNIDLEAWEPCKLCGRLGEVDPCYKDGCFKENAPKCDFRCDKFLDWRADKRRLDGAMFCPKCGRPLTPEARAMLEKRLRGYIE